MARANGKTAKSKVAKARPDGAKVTSMRDLTLTGIALHGFKSFREETEIAIRPLTILAGANSSGKSSAIQPLLLLKQTLEVGYDPGPLLLDGPNAHFTAMDQLLWHPVHERHQAEGFQIGLRYFEKETVRLYFSKSHPRGVVLERLDYAGHGTSYTLRTDLSHAALRKLFEPGFGHEDPLAKLITLHVAQDRCTLTVEAEVNAVETFPGHRFTRADPFQNFRGPIRGILHVPGLRGNPLRSYPIAQVGTRFPGQFQNYVASVVLAWKEAGDARSEQLDKAVLALGLSARVDARRLDDASIEIRVARLLSPRKGAAHDLVNIADVGFGVSQTLPVVVALLTAAPGQIVYLEQPEIHLHPRAQVALAGLLLDASRRGVVVVAETHSDLLLRAVQRAVAAGEVDPALVALHWFERDARGATKVSTAELSPAGTYGEWPVDFGDVSLEVEGAFLDASLFRRPA